MKKQDYLMNQTMKNFSFDYPMILPRKVINLIFIAIISLLIFRPSLWAFDKSSLHGTFISGEIESGFHGADINGGWGVNDEVILLRTETVFDGAGNFTLTRYAYKFVRNIGETGTPPSNRFQTTYSDNQSAPDTDSGTYTVSPGGGVTMNFSGGDSSVGYLSEDGRTLVFGWNEFYDGSKYCAMGLGAGIKRGSGFTESSLNGTYVFSEFESGFHDGESGYWGANDEQFWVKTEIAFDGTGGFTLSGHEYLIDREIGETGSPPSNQFTTTYGGDHSFSDSGTYTVSSAGEVTLNFNSGGNTTAYVGEGGKTMVFGWVEFDNDDRNCCMGFGMGVKRGSGFTNASVKGTYGVGLFESEFHGSDPYGGWGADDAQSLDKSKFTFDGAGNFRVVYDGYEMERNIGEVSGGGGYSNKFTTTYSEELNGRETGTYTVSSDGVVTLNFSDGDTGPAYLSEDGKTFVIGWSEYNDGPSDYGVTGLGFGVKVPKVNSDLPAITLLLLGG